MMDTHEKPLRTGEIVRNSGSKTTNGPPPSTPGFYTPVVGSAASPATSATKPPKIPPEPSKPSALKRSVYSKPKSRFWEQPVRIDSNLFEEKLKLTSREQIASPAPLDDQNEEEDEEAEIFEEVEWGEKRQRVKFKTLVKLVLAFCITGCLIGSLTVQKFRNSFLWRLESWKWCFFLTVTFCGLVVTSWFTHFIVFIIEMNFLLRKKLLYFVYGLKKSVQVTVWLAFVLGTWVLLFHHGPSRSQRSKTANVILVDITWTLVSFFIGAILWLFKTLFLQIIASNFHMNQYFDRIHETIFHQYVLHSLSGPALIEEAERVGRPVSSGHLSLRSKKKNKGGKEEVIDMGKLHRMKRENVSAWTMKVLVDAVMNSELSTVSNALDKCIGNGEEPRDIEITNEMEAIAAAYKIFKNVAHHANNYVEEDDLLRFMIKEEVGLVLSLFEGRINKKSLVNWVVKVCQGRKMLAHSLNDTKTAVKQLDKLVRVIVIITTVIIWLLLMEIATTEVLIVLTSQLVVAASVFGDTCMTTFEALIFVFVMHPFDVGDRCVVDGVQMTVEEMNILTTVFLKLNNEKVYYPNSVLATKPIGNYYRSPDMTPWERDWSSQGE